MRLKIEISLENAAFEENVEREVQRILRGVSMWDLLPHDCKIPGGCGHEIGPVKLRDSNGNTVGFAEVVED